MGKVAIKVVFGGFIILNLISCRPSKVVRNSFKLTNYCYDGVPTKLNEKINLAGYYTFTHIYYDKAKKVNNSFNVFFHKDGTFIYQYNLEYNGGLWGRYIIENDTIKAQFIETPGGMSWDKGEIWFKIINTEAIEWVFLKYYSPITESNLAEYQASGKKWDITLGKFMPYSNTPNPDTAKYNWLKKRKWFWCDKNEYRKWKKSL